MKAISIVAIGAVALLGVSACSSEKSITTPLDSVDADDLDTLPGGITIPDTLPGGITIPDTLPGGITIPNTLPGGITIPDTLPGGVTIPSLPGGTPGGFSQDCLKYFQALAIALSGDATALATLEEGFSELADAVPEELKDDLEVVKEGYTKLAELLREYNGDISQAYSDPDVLALFSDPEFTLASSNLSTWLNTECQSGG